MIFKINYLKWDSEFFNYKIGEAYIETFKINKYTCFVEDVRKNKFKLLYIYPCKDSISEKLNNIGVPLVDVKIVYYKCITDKIISPKHKIESFYEKILSKELLELSYLSGKYSRFKTDEMFRNDEFERLYKEWILKSINRKIADDVLVYKHMDTIKGFLTYKIKDSHIQIGLIAVNENYSGEGIGKSLMYSLEHIAFEKQIDYVLVSTQQKNEKACLFYTSLGYKIKSIQPIHHLWL